MSEDEQTLTGGFDPNPEDPPAPVPPPNADSAEQTLTGGFQSPVASPNSEEQTLTGGFQSPVASPNQEEQTLTGGLGGVPGDADPAIDSSGDAQTLTGGMGTAPSAGSDASIGAQTLTGGLLSGGMPSAGLWNVGDLIDERYEVLGEAGRGGMGVVYRVRHREWDVEMAVKTPLPGMIGDPASRARFYREAQTWVDLGMHPNIVQCWYVRDLGSVPRIFSDFLHGGSLKDWFKGGRIIPGSWEQIIDLIIQAADGLGYAHESGLVHRDVKPGNLLMTEDGRLCVTDFGLVKIGGEEAFAGSEDASIPDDEAGDGLTIAGALMGTPEYGAPEQWSGGQVVDTRADVYAMGVVLYELSSGRRPFDDGSHSEPARVLLGRHIMTTPPDPRDFRADIPEPLVDIMMQCLIKDPDQRMPSMDSLRTALEQAHEAILSKPYPRPKPKAVEARAGGLNNRAVSFWDLGQGELAYKAWEEALGLDPQHPEALFNRGLMQWRDGEATDDDVAQVLERARGKRPLASYYLGQIQLETLNVQASERSLDAALKDPGIAEMGAVWRALGHTRMAQETYAEAAVAYQKGTERLPHDPVCKTGLRMAEAETRTHGSRVIFKNRCCLRSFEGRVGTVQALAMSIDGMHVFVDQGSDAFSRWDLHSGKIDGTYFGHERALTALAVSQDGTRILSGSEDSRLRLWRIASRDFDEDFYGQGHMGTITSLSFLPDGAHAVSGGGDRSVRFWELENGNAMNTWWGHERGVNAVRISPDGNRIVSGGDDGCLAGWQPGNKDAIVKFSGVMPQVKDLLFIPNDMNRLMVAGSEGGLFIFDLASGEIEKKFSGHQGIVNCLAITPDGRFMISGGDDRTLRIWDIVSGRCLRTFSASEGEGAGEGPEGPILKVVLSPDGSQAVTGARENLGHPLRLWDLALPGKENDGLFSSRMAISRAQNQQQSQLRSDSFQKLLASVETLWNKKEFSGAYRALKKAREINGFEQDPDAFEWNVRLSKHLPLTSLGNCFEGNAWPAGHAKEIAQVSLTSDGKLAATSGKEDKNIRLWDLEEGSCVKVIDDNKNWVEAVTLSLTGRFLLVGGCDGSVRIWDGQKDWECVRTCMSHMAEVQVVVVDRDERLFYSGGNDQSIRICKLEDGEAVRVMEDLDGPVEYLVPMPDQGLVASAIQGGAIAIWSLRTGKCLKTFSGHEGGVTGLCVTQDSRFIVSSGADRCIRIWSPDTGREVRSLSDGRAAINSLALIGDGKLAVTGAKDHSDSSLRLWDLEKGTCLRTFAAHPAGVSSVATIGNGSMVLSAGLDRKLRKWNLDWDLDAGLEVPVAVPPSIPSTPPASDVPRPPSSPFKRLPAIKKEKDKGTDKNPFAF